MRMEFIEFKNCKMSTDEIMGNIRTFSEKEQQEIIKYMYSLLFYTDIKVEEKSDINKIISTYLGYIQGKFVTMII